MDERQLETLLCQWYSKALARARRSLYASIANTCADDVVQDASLIFIEKVRNQELRHLSLEGQLCAFFMTIVTNCALRRNAASSRQTKRHVSNKTVEAVLEGLCDEENTPEALIESLQSQQSKDGRLIKLIQMSYKLLSKQQNEIFHLIYVQGLKPEQVAQTLQRSRQQIDTVLSIVRTKLRKALRSESLE